MEKKTKKRHLFNPNQPVSKCHVAELVRVFPKILASLFGYKVDNWDGSNPIHLPFPLGEISNEFLGSGIDEGLAHIYRLLMALRSKWNKPELDGAIDFFVSMRAKLWEIILAIGTVDKKTRYD